MIRWIGFGSLVTLGVALVVGQVFGSETQPGGPIVVGVGFLVYAFLGGLIIARRDGHLTGWLLTSSGLAIVFADGFGRLPFVGADLSAWVQSWAWTAVFALFAAMTITFPSGHSPQGPAVAARLGRAALYSLPLLVVMGAFTKTVGGPEAATGAINPLGFLPEAFSWISLLATVGVLLSGTVSLIVRRRRTSGVEKAQLTWVVFALATFITLIAATLVFIFASLALTGVDPGDDAWAGVFIVMVMFPISFAVAILRYRLFDIDRIVSRTVTYTIVGTMLTGTFFALVTLLGSLIPVDDSSWQIATATLAVAALFNPALRRVRSFVNRRFNRSRYDSQTVAAELTGRISNEVNPTVIGDAWTEVVVSVMQPTTISLWLKDSSARP